MSERFLAISLNELRHLEIYCNKCGTGLVINLEYRTTKLPEQCPACTVPFNKGGLAKAIQKGLEFVEEMKDFKKPPQFRIKEPSTREA